MILSNGIFNVVADLWSLSGLEHFLNLGDNLAVILWVKVHVFLEPFLGAFEKLTFFDACSTDLELSRVIFACSWVGLGLMTTECN